jgi:hypothetical protein
MAFSNGHTLGLTKTKRSFFKQLKIKEQIST